MSPDLVGGHVNDCDGTRGSRHGGADTGRDHGHQRRLACRCQRQIDDAGKADGDAQQRHFEFRILLPLAVELVDQTPCEEHTQWSGGQNNEAVSQANITHGPAVYAGETGRYPGEQRIAHDGVHRHA